MFLQTKNEKNRNDQQHWYFMKNSKKNNHSTKGKAIKDYFKAVICVRSSIHRYSISNKTDFVSLSFFF